MDKLHIVAELMNEWTRTENTSYKDEVSRLTLENTRLKMEIQLATRRMFQYQAEINEVNRLMDINTDHNTRLNHEVAEREWYIQVLEDMLEMPRPVRRRLEFETIDLTTDSDIETEYEDMDV